MKLKTSYLTPKRNMLHVVVMGGMKFQLFLQRNLDRTNEFENKKRLYHFWLDAWIGALLYTNYNTNYTFRNFGADGDLQSFYYIQLDYDLLVLFQDNIVVLFLVYLNLRLNFIFRFYVRLSKQKGFLIFQKDVQRET